MGNWPDEPLESEAKVLTTLLDLQGKRWISRGEPDVYPTMLPSIDRDRPQASRAEKLSIERQSIDIFRSTARFFSGTAERDALRDDRIALMVLRHYGVLTRLLDWSMSPYVAAYFAVESEDDKDGFIWSFDHDLYAKNGRKQWTAFPETTTDGSGDPEKWDPTLRAAFTLEEPNDWFVCLFYPATEFPRQNAQNALYTLTARFGQCHAEAISRLLRNQGAYRRYVIKADIKAKLRTTLREKHGIWRGSLYPDSAGAAETVKRAVPQLPKRVVPE